MVAVEFNWDYWKRKRKRAEGRPERGIAAWRYWAEPSSSAARKSWDVEGVFAEICFPEEKTKSWKYASTYSRAVMSLGH